MGNTTDTFVSLVEDFEDGKEDMEDIADAYNVSIKVQKSGVCLSLYKCTIIL